MTRLDIERHGELVDYLRETGRIASAERPVVQTLSGGVSNRTVLVERPNGERWVLKQALGKLRVQVDWYCSPERVHREAVGLRWLKRLAPTGTITCFLFEDRDCHLLAMEAVPEPHENWKAMLIAGRLDLELVKQFAAILRSIHRNALDHREQLEQAFGDRSFFESLRLEPYYIYTSQQIPEAGAFLTRLVDETRAHRDTLVHGDYSPKNMLVHEGRLVLLDHEVVHIGDPAFDVGFALAHLLSKAHHLAGRRSEFERAALVFWQAYAGDPDLEARAVRHTLGCLLARVAGRSPLEYLDETERSRQARTVLALFARPPHRMSTLVSRFVRDL